MSQDAAGAHAVIQEAINAGVHGSGGGPETQSASIVATDGPHPRAIGGFTLVEMPARDEAHREGVIFYLTVN